MTTKEWVLIGIVKGWDLAIENTPRIAICGGMGLLLGHFWLYPLMGIKSLPYQLIYAYILLLFIHLMMCIIISILITVFYIRPKYDADGLLLMDETQCHTTKSLHTKP